MSPPAVPMNCFRSYFKIGFCECSRIHSLVKVVGLYAIGRSVSVAPEWAHFTCSYAGQSPEGSES